MKIAILGFGREGRSLLAFLRNDARFKNAEIWVLDADPRTEVPRGIQKQLGKKYLKNLSKFDTIFRSPGFPYAHPSLREARKAGVTISSPIRLFFDEAHKRTKNIIGVTGTKGKGTTATLIYNILKAAGCSALLAGNIGKPALDILPKVRKNSWIVLEFSSFQLIDMRASPHIAVALMVTSEHLDWHATVKEYVTAKSNIVRFQSACDIAVIAQDYPKSLSYAGMTRANVFTFSRQTEARKGTWVQNGHFWFSDGKKSAGGESASGGKERICPISNLQIPGAHNWENAGAAITVAKILHIPNAVIAKTLRGFRGLEHRLEFVRSVNGVKYYNDSYATTPETAEAAIKAFDAPKIIVLGGSSKSSDFEALGGVVSRSKSMRAVIGIGKEWPRIKKHISSSSLRIIEGCKNMEQVVRAASRIALPGDVVLLSPACASFDMFKNYADRGAQFKKLVRMLVSR